jgi:hypothetical protein
MRKGICYNTGRTHFKKGHIPWNKGEINLAVTGERNYFWKGGSTKYHSVHTWLKNHVKKPKECVWCGVESWEKRIEWASISHKAKRDMSDFIPLCSSCHGQYDRKGGGYFALK